MWALLVLSRQAIAHVDRALGWAGQPATGLGQLVRGLLHTARDLRVGVCGRELCVVQYR